MKASKSTSSAKSTKSAAHVNRVLKEVEAKKAARLAKRRETDAARRAKKKQAANVIPMPVSAPVAEYTAPEIAFQAAFTLESEPVTVTKVAPVTQAPAADGIEVLRWDPVAKLIRLRGIALYHNGKTVKQVGKAMDACLAAFAKEHGLADGTKFQWEAIRGDGRIVAVLHDGELATVARKN